MYAKSFGKTLPRQNFERKPVQNLQIQTNQPRDRQAEMEVVWRLDVETAVYQTMLYYF